MSENYCLSNQEAIDKLNAHLKQGRRVDALDLVYCHVDELCLLGRLIEANEFGKLLLADYYAPPSIYLSYITVTFPWRNELPDRLVFINKIREDHQSILEFLDRMV